MRNLHKSLFKNNSPFAKATIAALIVGFGSIFATVTDICWLIGDMSRDAQGYHYFVLAGLTISTLGMSISFVWLYVAINKYLTKHSKKERDKQVTKARARLASLNTHIPTHCGVKAKAKKEPRYIEAED